MITLALFASFAVLLVVVVAVSMSDRAMNVTTDHIALGFLYVCVAPALIVGTFAFAVLSVIVPLS